MTTLIGTKQQRITSLDWVRGVMLVASVGVNSLLGMPEWFDHARWASVHPLDMIFPLFVTLSGCGLAFSMARRVKLGPLWRRVAVLAVLGLLYNAIVLNSWDIATWRVTGVLQLYAVVVAVIGTLHLLTRTWVGWAIITGAFASAQTFLLTAYATGCPALLLTPGCNPAGPIDVALLGANHVYRVGTFGHDPEGLVAILGALVCASAGAVAGHLLLARRRRAQELGDSGVWFMTWPLLAVGIALLLASQLTIVIPDIAAGVDLPVMKRMWTAPFALIAAGITVIGLLAAHLIVDRPRDSRALEFVSYPLIALGRNSLLVYFGSHVLMSLLIRPIGAGPSIAAVVSTSVTPGGAGYELVWTVLVLTFWIALACVLHHFRIYVRPR